MIRLKRKKRAKRPTPTGPIRSEAHKRWVRGFICAAGYIDCEGKIEAAHVRTGTNGGTGVKPGDDFTIPLCSKHHGIQHVIGEAEFEKRHKIDMKAIALDLAQRSPHLRKLRA